MENHRDDFDARLIALLPRLRVQALGLARNSAAADDLVQGAAANALVAWESFTPGSNFPAWMHRVLRNQFVNGVRKRRPTGDIADAPQATLAVPGAQMDSLALKELQRGLERLPADQREGLLLVVLHGMSYEEASEATGCAVGTMKSRVFRARYLLQACLMGEVALPAAKEPGESAAVGRRRRRRDERFRPAYVPRAPHHRQLPTVT